MTWHCGGQLRDISKAESISSWYTLGQCGVVQRWTATTIVMCSWEILTVDVMAGRMDMIQSQLTGTSNV